VKEILKRQLILGEAQAELGSQAGKTAGTACGKALVPKSPSWGNRAGRMLRIADDLSRGQL